LSRSPSFVTRSSRPPRVTATTPRHEAAPAPPPPPPRAATNVPPPRACREKRHQHIAIAPQRRRFRNNGVAARDAVVRPRARRVAAMLNPRVPALQAPTVADVDNANVRCDHPRQATSKRERVVGRGTGCGGGGAGDPFPADRNDASVKCDWELLVVPTEHKTVVARAPAPTAPRPPPAANQTISRPA
jgi:hypothetical protein